MADRLRVARRRCRGRRGRGRRGRGWGFKFFVCIFINSSLSLFQGFIFMSFIPISSFNARFCSHLISFSSSHYIILVIVNKLIVKCKICLFDFKLQHVRPEIMWFFGILVQ